MLLFFGQIDPWLFVPILFVPCLFTITICRAKRVLLKCRSWPTLFHLTATTTLVVVQVVSPSSPAGRLRRARQWSIIHRKNETSRRRRKTIIIITTRGYHDSSLSSLSLSFLGVSYSHAIQKVPHAREWGTVFENRPPRVGDAFFVCGSPRKKSFPHAGAWGKLFKKPYSSAGFCS